MSGFEAFLKQNKKEIENKKIPASKAFLDEKGSPMLWEIRAVTSKEAGVIRKVCNKITKRGELIVDNDAFNRSFAAKATVYPNLNDAGLQDSYGVKCAEDLIVEMLDNDGEYQKYVKEILNLSGYDSTDDQLVETAKN